MGITEFVLLKIYETVSQVQQAASKPSEHDNGRRVHTALPRCGACQGRTCPQANQRSTRRMTIVSSIYLASMCRTMSGEGYCCKVHRLWCNIQSRVFPSDNVAPSGNSARGLTPFRLAPRQQTRDLVGGACWRGIDELTTANEDHDSSHYSESGTRPCLGGAAYCTRCFGADPDTGRMSNDKWAIWQWHNRP